MKLYKRMIDLRNWVSENMADLVGNAAIDCLGDDKSGIVDFEFTTNQIYIKFKGIMLTLDNTKVSWNTYHRNDMLIEFDYTKAELPESWSKFFKEIKKIMADFDFYCERCGIRYEHAGDMGEECCIYCEQREEEYAADVKGCNQFHAEHEEGR